LVTLVKRVNLDNKVRLALLVHKVSPGLMVLVETEERSGTQVQRDLQALQVIGVIQDLRERMDSRDNQGRRVHKAAKDLWVVQGLLEGMDNLVSRGDQELKDLLVL